MNVRRCGQIIRSLFIPPVYVADDREDEGIPEIGRVKGIPGRIPAVLHRTFFPLYQAFLVWFLK